jgi:hypothetical protein
LVLIQLLTPQSRSFACKGGLKRELGNQKNLACIKEILAAPAFQPVLAQAKACGYIFDFQIDPARQNSCRTILEF